MLQTIVRVCQVAFFALGAVTLGWFLVGKLSGERRREMNPWERTCAERAVALVVDQLPRRDAIKRLLVWPVRGDYDERITDILVDGLGTRPEYDIIDARKELKAVPSDWKTALETMQKLKASTRADGVLYTTVERETPRDGVGTKVDMDARLVPLVGQESSGVIDSARRLAGVVFPSLAPEQAREEAGEEVHPPAQEIRSRASIDWWSGEMEQTSRLLRLAIWAAAVGALPFALFPVVQAVTRRENNRLNAAMLAGMAAANMAVALALLGLRVGLFDALLVALAGFAGFLYDFVICDKIDEMRR